MLEWALAATVEMSNCVNKNKPANAKQNSGTT
jgi:hypothetical protein